MATIKKDVTRYVAKIFNLDFDSLEFLPCCVFWKNLEGTYQGYNDNGAKSLGYSGVQDIVGKTDHQIFLPDKANIYRQNDYRALQSKQQIVAAEEGILKGTPVIFLSYKLPLFDENEHLQGMLGLSFTRPAYQKDNQILPLEDLSLQALEKNFAPKLIGLAAHESKKMLSQRERDCANLLYRGLTIKQIAKNLCLSPRTVETYIERLKIKFNCKNKAELLVAYIEHNINFLNSPFSNSN